MRLAGVHGHDRPSMDVLARAEAPPAAEWRSLNVPEVTQKDILLAATTMIDTPEWRERQTKITSRPEQIRSATAEATSRLISEWSARPRREMVNASVFHQGQRLAAQWRGTLDALADLLDQAEEWVADLNLSAVSEAELKQMAEVEAADWRSVLTAMHHAGEREATSDERRAVDSAAQLRKLRARAGAASQHAAAVFGTVGQGAAHYADDHTMSRWMDRQAAKAAFAAGMVLVTAKGKALPMSDIMDTKERADLARLYAMAKAMDETAVRNGWSAAFLTLTLPPEYHPNPANGGDAYDPNMSPKEADRALNRLLAKLRARMAKAKIPTFGLRVVEPHRDGCPHSHVLAYMPKDDIAKVDAMLQALRPEPVPGQRRATQCVRIDRGRASPTTYVFKYLMKAMNVRPETDEQSHEDGDHLTNYDRVRAWASERRIRRWAVWGTHGVQRVWQTLHQRKALPGDAPQPVMDAWNAIRENRHADALDAMGAIRGSGKARVRLTYEEVETAYGDTRRNPCGIIVEGTDWTMALKQSESRILSRSELEMERSHREEEDQADAKREAMHQWRAALARGERATHPATLGWVTLAVSYPRVGSEAGEGGNPRSTAGPPGPAEAPAAPAVPPASHPQPQVSRIPPEWAGRAAALPRRFRVTPDDLDREAERALAASRDGLAKAVSFESYEDAPEGCF